MTRGRRCHFAHHHPACTCQRHVLSHELVALRDSLRRWSKSTSAQRSLGLSLGAAALLGGCAHVSRNNYDTLRERANHQGYSSHSWLPDKRPYTSPEREVPQAPGVPECTPETGGSCTPPANPEVASVRLYTDHTRALR